MTEEELAALDRQLVANEARRTYLYDDATGARITKGSKVIGHPTIGIGFNLDAVDVPNDVIDLWYETLRNRLINAIFDALPWAQHLPSGPLRAVIDIGWNAGLHGLLAFHQTLSALERGDMETAALAVERSHLDVHRAARLAALIRSK